MIVSAACRISPRRLTFPERFFLAAIDVPPVPLLASRPALLAMGTRSLSEFVSPALRLTISISFTIVSAHLVSIPCFVASRTDFTECSFSRLTAHHERRFLMRFKEIRREMLALAPAFLLIAAVSLGQPPQDSQIHVEITGLRNEK